jgi:hypothetical protein
LSCLLALLDGMELRQCIITSIPHHLCFLLIWLSNLRVSWAIAALTACQAYPSYTWARVCKTSLQNHAGSFEHYLLIATLKATILGFTVEGYVVKPQYVGVVNLFLLC